MDKQRLISELEELQLDIKADAERKLLAVGVLLNHLKQGDEQSGQESLLSDYLSSGMTTPPPRAYGDGEPHSANGNSETINLAQEVREAIHETSSNTFTQRMVTRTIERKHPRATIRAATVSNTIARLVKNGYVKRVRRGQGSQLSLYRKAETWPSEGWPRLEEEEVEDVQEDVVEEHRE